MSVNQQTRRSGHGTSHATSGRMSCKHGERPLVVAITPNRLPQGTDAFGDHRPHVGDRVLLLDEHNAPQWMVVGWVIFQDGAPVIGAALPDTPPPPPPPRSSEVRGAALPDTPPPPPPP